MTQEDISDELKKKIVATMKKKAGFGLNALEQQRAAKTISELFMDSEFQKTLEKLFHKTSSHKDKAVPTKKTTGLTAKLAGLQQIPASANKQETKKGFHTRFQRIDETTIQETNEWGSTRVFHFNKEKDVWEVEGGFPLKAELRVLGKDVFNVTEIDRGIRTETLYSPARKIQETFIRGTNGKDYLYERTDEDLNGTRDRQLFNEKRQMIEQRVSVNRALKKLVIDGKVKFDDMKTTGSQLNCTIRKNNIPTR